MSQTDYNFESDERLFQLIQQNDHVAFTEIYRRYWHILFLHANKIVQDHETAEDIIQEIFATIWNKAVTISISTSVKAYLYSTVRYQTLNVINREKVKGRYLDSLSTFIVSDSSFTEERVRFNELTHIIEAELENLPPKMQAVFKLSRNEGLAHKAIAEELGISENTVKSTINRALKMMRSKLASLFFFFF